MGFIAPGITAAGVSSHPVTLRHALLALENVFDDLFELVDVVHSGMIETLCHVIITTRRQELLHVLLRVASTLLELQASVLSIAVQSI
ncbi:hypothetical protein PC129_g25224 [Phytophthora cactorum]|uniref:Uncharacterized protein n=1 Tax=Phytophthora cactorum TaxID=29920 RepID=A0A8T1GPY1_9STRA|nr:hypothetical protein C6341_g28012 [Phytophthora cactorum]KAG3187894.1 hypothetical protein PC129_g25224 [Phytophthora cactorum]